MIQRRHLSRDDLLPPGQPVAEPAGPGHQLAVVVVHASHQEVDEVEARPDISQVQGEPADPQLPAANRCSTINKVELQGMVDGSAAKPALRQDTGF